MQRILAEFVSREGAWLARLEQGEEPLELLEFYRLTRACGPAGLRVAADVGRRIGVG